MIATECPSASSVRARPDPTLPQPQMTTCTIPFKQVARTTGGRARVLGMGHTAAVEEPRPEAPSTRRLAPERVEPLSALAYPESWAYRLKNRILGPPMISEQLTQERLATPIGIGVLAPDMISSSAYGTEEMLRIMVPIIGIGAFSMVIPITLAILAVMFFVMFSYLQVIGVYTRIGGSYVVARDNFGPKVAQVAAVALLIDYTVTVAVQTSAGTAALTSAYPTLVPYTVAITIGVTLLMLFANLRGIREAGAFFAIPTYFYIASLAFVVITGLVKAALGTLQAHALPSAATLGYPVGHQTGGWLMGLGVFYCLKAFANGGVSLTGMEAVSDGISSFRPPVARNGRKALVTMCAILGFLVLGTSILAHLTHAVPFEAGTPTVVSQEVRYVLGSTWVGSALFYVVQAATVLILFTGGNTSFNGFPYLASFVAGDSFLPRQLTKRGHRLAFSNGIFVLAVVAILLIIAFKAQLNALVGLYAVGVFTGFTFAGFGMVKHNLRLRERRWKLGVVVNAFSGTMSLAVVGILLVTKFTEGAWIVAVVGPPMYYGLIRLHREYVEEEKQLETGAAAATEAPVLQRHEVVVFVDQLDMASARALQYARTLRPDELRVVHFNIDTAATEELKDEWEQTRPPAPAARHRGVPGPAPRTRRARIRRRHRGRRADRVHGAASPPCVPFASRAPAARSNRRSDRRRRGNGRPCRGDDRSVQRGDASHGGSFAPARYELILSVVRRRRARGWIEHSRSGQPGPWRSTRLHSVSGSGSQDVSARSVSRLRRAPPIWSAR